MTINLYKIEHDLTIWLSIASDKIRQSLNDPLHVTTKSGRNDLVTNIDKQIEQFYVEQIRAGYPDAKICGEEGFGDNITSLKGLVFFVDPIDGTMNFVRQRAHFATMIGVYWDGEPLTGAIMDVMASELLLGGLQTGVTLNGRPVPKLPNVPLTDGLIGINAAMFAKNQQQVRDLGQASSGVRMTGSAGIEFLQVITQQQIGYISWLSPWDVAAGWAIGAGVGVQVYRPDGSVPALRERDVIVAGIPNVWQKYMALQVKQ